MAKKFYWIVIALFVLAHIVAWSFIFRGGMSGITVWYVYHAFFPLVAFCLGIAVLIVGIVSRKLGAVFWGTLSLSVASVIPLAVFLGFIKTEYPTSLESTHPEIVVALPANGPLKVAWGGDDIEHNYHAKSPDQRWAYDFVKDPSFLGSGRLEDYGCYGSPVLAPISGTVAHAVDGARDEIPGALSLNTKNPCGNIVAIKTKLDTYVVLCHLRRGSILVQAGDTVTQGQQIGECGNSGNTSEPHIHIHHQRQNPADFPVGFAEGLPLYFAINGKKEMPLGGLDVKPDGSIVPKGQVVP